MRVHEVAILSCPRLALCAAIITIIATVSAQGQYKLVQGRVIPRNSPDWTVISENIEVTGFLGGALICRTFTIRNVESISMTGGAHGGRAVSGTREVRDYKESFVLTNYPTSGRFRIGDVITGPIAVMRVGSAIAQAGVVDFSSGGGASTTTYSSGGGYSHTYSSGRTHGSGHLHDLYDYGVDYVPPARQLTPEEAAAAKAQAAKMNTRVEAAKLKFDEEQAEDGKDLYQYRMGVRYLKGDGVPTDMPKAIEYLSKAAAQGNQDAKKQLAKLTSQASEPQTTVSPKQAGEH